MDIKQNLNEEDCIQLLNLLIPEGTEESLNSPDSEIYFSNKNGHIKIKIDINPSKKEETFNDTETKELVNEFKESLKELDDSVFLEASEKAEKAINMKRFDELLNKERYSEAEATEIESLIDYFSQLICAILQSRINELFIMSERF